MGRLGVKGGMDAMLTLARPWVASHEQTRERLSAYLEGELEGRELKRVDRHLALCPMCREVLQSLARALDRLRSLGTADVPAPAGPPLRETVVERLRRESG